MLQVLALSDAEAKSCLERELRNLRQHPIMTRSYAEVLTENTEQLALMNNAPESWIGQSQKNGQQPVITSPELQAKVVVGPTFKEVAEAFLHEKTASEEWTGRTLKNRAAKVRNIVEMVGEDKVFTTLTSVEAIEIRDKIYRFPKNRGKMPNIRDKSLAQIFKMSPSDYDTIDATTANSFLSIFKQICEFAVPRFHDVNVTTGISPRKVPKAKRQRKRSFATLNTEHLTALLSAHHYREYEKRKKVVYTADKFWVPLIGMFSGARVGEILQLRVCDIIHSDQHECWYFDLNDNHEGNRLKTDNSRRWVPIHSSLLSLGFLDFVSSRGEGNEHLFNEVIYSGQEDDSNSFSRWFERTLRKEIGWSQERKETFHSLRHTFVDNLRRMTRLHDWEIAAVVGHLPSDDGLTTSRYGTHQLDLKRKQQIVESLDYGIELSGLSWLRYRRCFLD
ncbi:site-specific integrase [Oceanimonas sp. CAM02]|uniref:site-specific integrase n=1 Tax=Oceanimonas sp. CAM02 TaxID=3080336 RepID=UPI0029368692|nr:site-specific integrase [Oceanimonas sp. CAM02]MDV2858275.1 site-specific integrase [Oceanimonas sp. CAM02]